MRRRPSKSTSSRVSSRRAEWASPGPRPSSPRSPTRSLRQPASVCVSCRSTLPRSSGASVPNQKFLSTLGVDGDRAVTKPFDGGQDVVGGFGPAKGLGVGIAGVDVGGDGGLQRGGRAVGAALDLLVGEQREEALDLVDP